VCETDTLPPESVHYNCKVPKAGMVQNDSPACCNVAQSSVYYGCVNNCAPLSIKISKMKMYAYTCVFDRTYFCMYVCMYVCMYIYMYTCVYTSIYMYVCIYICIYVCIYISVCAYIHVCMHECQHERVNMYACMYVDDCRCVFVYVQRNVNVECR